MDINHM
jgi:hypothetical protein